MFRRNMLPNYQATRCHNTYYHYTLQKPQTSYIFHKYFGLYAYWLLGKHEPAHRACDHESCGSQVGIGTRLRAELPERFRLALEPTKHSSFLEVENGRSVNLTNLLHLVPRLRLSAAVSLLPLYLL